MRCQVLLVREHEWVGGRVFKGQQLDVNIQARPAEMRSMQEFKMMDLADLGLGKPWMARGLGVIFSAAAHGLLG